LPLDRRIQYRKNKIRFTSSSESTRNSFLFDRIARRANPGGIREPHGNPIPNGSPFNNVPGRPWHRSNNGPVFPQEGIQKSRFAYVGAPKNGDENTIPPTPISLKCPDQASGKRKSIPKVFCHRDPIDVTDIFFIEVKPDFDQREGFDNTVFQLQYELRKAAVHTPICRIQAGLATRLDEVNNRFSLEQIEPTVEESTPRKFPGSSEDSPSGNSGLDQTFENDDAPVAANFDCIFTGVGSRPFQHPTQAGIHLFTIDKNLPKFDVANPLPEGRLAKENLSTDGYGVRATQAHQTDPSLPGRGRNGDDCVEWDQLGGGRGKRGRKNPPDHPVV